VGFDLRRAIRLAAVFLRGIENAFFANGVCGEPFQPEDFYLHKYFDGARFQLYMSHCVNSNPVVEELVAFNYFNLLI
jgi:hypothetical protein